MDLNRRWKGPNRALHPTIFALKKAIKALQKERPIELICDLHGHSRRHNIFMYGCDIPGKPAATRAFPFIVSKLSTHFSYRFCSFRMQKSKESTMRITEFKDTRVPAVYTLEASFYGPTAGPLQGQHYSMEHLQEMGMQLAKALMIYCDLKLPAVVADLQPELTRHAVMEELLGNEELCQEPEDMSSSGSDSEPSADNFSPKELPELIQASLKKTAEPVKRHTTGPVKGSPARAVPAQKPKPADLKKCTQCSSVDSPGHVCRKATAKLRPIQQRSFSGIYRNHLGKKVRDQMTQTSPMAPNRTSDPRLELFDRRASSVSHRNSPQSVKNAGRGLSGTVDRILRGKGTPRFSVGLSQTLRAPQWAMSPGKR